MEQKVWIVMLSDYGHESPVKTLGHKPDNEELKAICEDYNPNQNYIDTGRCSVVECDFQE
jgi:hypothetical protein